MAVDWNQFTPRASPVPMPMPMAAGAASMFALVMLAGMLLHDNVRARRQRKVAPA